MSADPTPWPEELSAQRIFSTVASSMAAGMVVWAAATLIHLALNDTASQEALGENLPNAITLITVISLVLIAVFMAFRHKLAEMVSDIPAYVMAIGMVAAGWWLLFRSGALEAEGALTLEVSILVIGGSALALLLGGLLVDGFALARRIWLCMASTLTGVLLGGLLFMLFRSGFLAVVGLASAPVVVAHALAGVAAGFVAVRVARNLLLGIEDGFLKSSALYVVAGTVVVLTGLLGPSALRDAGVSPQVALGVSGAAAVAWLLLAMMMQRPNVFRVPGD